MHMVQNISFFEWDFYVGSKSYGLAAGDGHELQFERPERAISFPASTRQKFVFLWHKKRCVTPGDMK